MADVINRTTFRFIRSVNTPDFPVADWIINPDLSGVAGVPQRHWKVVGDTVVEMNATEKDRVDNPPLAPVFISAVNKLRGLGFTDPEIRALGYRTP